jgi:hypothetical protein
MANLYNVFERLKDQPRSVLVRSLINKGSVDSLTNLKLKLAEECGRLDGCPRGECFSRRTPKESSTYEGLEERLANDIAELSNFLNTEIVTSELRNMFKVPVVSVDKT